MNGDTRVVGWKSAGPHGDSMQARINGVFDTIDRQRSIDTEGETLKAKSLRIAREHAPIQIPSLEC